MLKDDKSREQVKISDLLNLISLHGEKWEIIKFLPEAGNSIAISTTTVDSAFIVSFGVDHHNFQLRSHDILGMECTEKNCCQGH